MNSSQVQEIIIERRGALPPSLCYTEFVEE